MNYLPIFYNISDKKCLVVGAGAIAARKAELLLKAGGDLRVVAIEISEQSRLRQQVGVIDQGGVAEAAFTQIPQDAAAADQHDVVETIVVEIVEQDRMESGSLAALA